MKRIFSILLVAFLFGTATMLLNAQRQIEVLTRGTVAVRTSPTAVLVSWRWLATDVDDIAFNVYRDGAKLNSSPIDTKTNYVDNISTNGAYVVKAVIGGIEQESAEASAEKASVLANGYFDVPIKIPAGSTTPASQAYTYSANDASAGDVDGDGQYEIILKWDPSNSKDNSQSGYTGNVFIDAYKLDGTQLWRIDLGKNIRAGAHYTQFMVYDLDGDGKAEVACKTSSNTKDGKGNYLAMGPAAADNDATDYRNASGYILTGPEYLTVFNGLTGAEMATANYNPQRGTVSSWGDDDGNRVDRFLACVAYLDGERPSLVMCRGYYARATLAAWDWRNGTLTQRWFFDSSVSGNSAYSGQGNHNLTAVDVDGDGKDEVVYGSCTINDNGTGLYSTGLGHGDALHVTDHDPSRAGYEVFAPHEESGQGISYRDAKTGAIIWQKRALADIGRGLAGDITPAFPGSEFWAAGMGMYNLKGDQISTGTPSINYLVWWDGDLSRELLDGTSITKYGGGTLLSATGCSSNNGTKSNPSLQADLWGDWREEVIWRTSDNSQLRIFSTPNSTDYRFRTLMHDPVYRLGVVWQNVAYNQPPHLSYFLGTDMMPPAVGPVMQTDLKWVGNNGSAWDLATVNWKNNASQALAYANGQSVLFSISGNSASPVVLDGQLSPSAVYVVSPSDYTFSGTGELTGVMSLVKSQGGKLTITGSHSYTGKTKVSDGLLVLDGALTQSLVVVESSGKLSGAGVFGQSVTVQNGGSYYVGLMQGAGNSQVSGDLALLGNANLVFDLSSNTSTGNDVLTIGGNLMLSGSNKLMLNKLDGVLGNGSYKLASITGTITGSLSSLVLDGTLGTTSTLEIVGNELFLKVQLPRAATSVVWSGAINNNMDLMTTQNWLNQSAADILAPNDNVLFDDAGNLSVTVVGDLPIGNVTVNATNAYTFSGDGAIAGNGSLTKENTGVLKLNKYNKYTGATIVNGGTIDLSFLNYAGQPSSIGAASAATSNLVVNGGKIRYSGLNAATNRGLSIGANGAELEISQAGTSLMLEGAITSGSLVKSGSGTLVLVKSGKLHDQLTINAGSVRLYSDDASPGKLVIFNSGSLSFMDNSYSYNTMSSNFEVPSAKTGAIYLDSRGYYTGTLTGAGTLNVYIPYTRADLNGNWSAFTGTINAINNGESGDFRFGNANGIPSALLNVGSGVWVYNITSVNTKIGALTGVGTLSGNHGWEIGGKGTTFVFDGTITAGSLNKVGSGRMTLTNANTYAGGTTITTGVILANNSSGSATGTGSVTVKSGAALSGTGSVSGAVIVQNGGNLLTGVLTSIGTLTVNNSVTFQQGGIFNVDVDPSNSTSDLLNVPTSSVTFTNATLQISRKAGYYASGQSFKVVSCPSISGAITTISPAEPATGLYWDLSELNTLGVIKITDVPTAIKPASLLSSVAVYPNPVVDELMVELPEGAINVTIDMVDINGRKVYALNNSLSQTIVIPMSSFNKGIYLLKITSGNDVVVRKVTKK